MRRFRGGPKEKKEGELKRIGACKYIVVRGVKRKLLKSRFP